MKKRLLLIFMCFVLFLCVAPLTACNEKQYSSDDIDKLFVSIQEGENTSQFFNLTNKFCLEVTFDSSVSSLPKTTLFSKVYSKYLVASSRFFSQLVSKNKDLVVSPIKHLVESCGLSQDAKNKLYNKLNEVKSNLEQLAETKKIFETSDGNLRYNELVANYKDVIDSLYDFNLFFANIYFDKVGKVDYSSTDTQLTTNNVADMMTYQLLKFSRVSYLFVMKNFTPTNPPASVSGWFDESQTDEEILLVKNFDSWYDWILGINFDPISNKESQLKNMFAVLQSEEGNFDAKYNLFVISLDNFDAKGFVNSTDKDFFVEEMNAFERSNYNACKNFLNEDFVAFCNLLNNLKICFY